MRRICLAVLVLVALVALGACLASRGPAPAPPVVREPRAVRVVVGDAEVRLEVASRTLTREDRTVRLVGTVHVGDPSFYAAVASSLAGTPAVLVEGLAPDPQAPPLPDDDVAIGLDTLALAFQADALPLGEGWRRSDLGVAEVRAALVARGIEPGPWLDERDRGSLRDLLAGAADDRSRALARLALLSGLSGAPPADEAYWDVIVGLRDAAVVADALAEPGGVAVVYGADHLPDLEARLVAVGFARVDERWLPAITVSYATLGLGPVQVRQLLR